MGTEVIQLPFRMVTEAQVPRCRGTCRIRKNIDRDELFNAIKSRPASVSNAQIGLQRRLCACSARVRVLPDADSPRFRAAQGARYAVAGGRSGHRPAFFTAWDGRHSQRRCR